VTIHQQPKLTLFAPEGRVPRPPGWQLIANTAGAHGFHIVDRTTPDRGVVTVCGVVGRVIKDPILVIPTCPACEAGIA
jgi:hypothetical protein